MSGNHSPLVRLKATNETNGREALAAAFLRALDPSPKLSAGTMAHIERVLGSHPRRARREQPSGWRLLRATALIIGILLAIPGAASAAYLVARSIRQSIPHPAQEVVPLRAPGATGALRSEPAPNAVEETPLPPPPDTAAALAPASPAPAPHRPIAHSPPRGARPTTAAPDPAALESAELQLGLTQKSRGELALAVTTLDRYRRDHPQGQFVGEAALAELDAELRLDRRADALALLRELGEAPELPRWDELRLLRAELEAEQGGCAAALRVFEESSTLQALAERALYDRASCLQKLGRIEESRRAFAAFLERYPEGRRSVEARRALGSGD
jgi:hypothetical protein